MKQQHTCYGNLRGLLYTFVYQLVSSSQYEFGPTISAQMLLVFVCLQAEVRWVAISKLLLHAFYVVL